MERFELMFHLNLNIYVFNKIIIFILFVFVRQFLWNGGCTSLTLSKNEIFDLFKSRI